MGRLLVVVDMQKDFVDGALGSKEALAIVPAVAQKIRSYREAGDEVVFTLDTHFDDYLDTMEGRKLPVVHCIKGTPGWELCKELQGLEGKRFEKVTFGSRRLAEYVAAGGYTSVELVGLCTDICVISNAMLIKAAVPDTVIEVDSACCAGVTPQSHENALEAMKMCHIDVK
ncbi:cysteine hydrolase family protein [Lacrimispora sp. 210928-DFI.3.58]|uniref:cysteine hydrolase family protein n=1 Tax=Lacrimispora sp. 210928-DFI.3.58 TaxID=2883214 RepID=UPI0015B6FEB2|nr:isochorismatase family cysteine hydrolase [Lacrimispora sp. 210928-DFI.3.58]MCB7320404.1 cysteine hydrolase [Lacrimispora sp. 210928-DFI.3.58]